MPQISDGHNYFSVAEQSEFIKRAIKEAEERLDARKTLDQCRVEFARDFANWAHQGHSRKFDPNVPYATHPHEIADEFEEPELKQLAEMHDIKEDTNITRELLDQIIIQHQGELIHLLTEEMRYDYDFIGKRKGERYFDYNSRMSERKNCALVKNEDRAHNKSQPLPIPLTDKQLLREQCRDVNEFYYDYVFQKNQHKEGLDRPRISLSEFLQDEEYGYLKILSSPERTKLFELIIRETSEEQEPDLREWLRKKVNTMNCQQVNSSAANFNHSPVL
jgi:hypothetical protein